MSHRGAIGSSPMANGLAIGPSEAEPFWLEFLRSLKGRGLEGVKLVISDAHTGLKAAIARDGECGCIRAVLPTLKPEYADALQRADLAGAPPHQAAQGLGIPANAMRVRLHRARQALRKALLRHCESCTGCDCAVCERGRSRSDAYRSQALAAS